MGTTTITVVLDGVTHEHQVYALGFEEAEAGVAVTGLTEQQRQTRHTISTFVGDVRTAAERVATTRYEPTAYQVLVTNGDPSIDIDSLDGHPIKPNELDWPFPDLPLAEHACIDVDAARAPTLTDALGHATQITIWRDAAQRPWILATRVALPGDEPCSPPG
jgi:hypothetical protein